MKTCSKCKTEQSLECFDKSSQAKDGLRYWCKSCVRDHYFSIKDKKYEKIKCECGEDVVKTYIDKHKETDIHRRRLNKIKKCSTCQKEKPLNEFNKNKSTGDGYSYVCKDCHREYHKKQSEEKIKCECGMEVGKLYLRLHKLRPVHTENMKSI